MSTAGQPLSPSANILGLYHFFSRMLPGLTLIVGMSLLFPASIVSSIATSPAAFIVLFMGFAAGQFVHSLVVIIEDEFFNFTKTHRDYFQDFLKSELADEGVPNEIEESESDKDVEGEEIGGADSDGGDPDAVVADRFAGAFKEVYGIEVDEIDADTIYTLIRSRIEIDRRGRTAQYQMMRSFSRSMVGAIGVVVILVAGAYVYGMLFPEGTNQPVITAFPPPVFAVFVGGLVGSMGIFQFGNIFYKKIYAKYLIVDFINIVDMV